MRQNSMNKDLVDSVVTSQYRSTVLLSHIMRKCAAKSLSYNGQKLWSTLRTNP